jgi:SAM-dependent methyltransferase
VLAQGYSLQPGDGEYDSLAVDSGSISDRAAAARAAVAANPVWYHSIELAPGVLTPGQVDLRDAARKLLPADLSGMRALDVGTFDGFWAFEMERRGAEVVAIDVEAIDSAEWPPLSRKRLEQRTSELGVELGRGFEQAAEALRSSVHRVVCDVYELTADAISGPVDFAFAGAILLHLRDPVRALERIHAALVPGGELRLMEPVSLALTLTSPRRPAARFSAAATDFNWWLPNLAALRAWPLAAGFADARRIGLVRPPSTKAMRQLYAGLACRRAD